MERIRDHLADPEVRLLIFAIGLGIYALLR
jgi:hypothetical protein